MIFTLATVCSLTFTTAFASTAQNVENVSTTLKDVSKIKTIEVFGNVELYISDDLNDEIKVYNDYYSDNAFLQNQNGILRITSYDAKKLVVWVKAKDLRSVVAHDNAFIKSFGKFSSISFDLELHDSATALLNIDAYTANISLKDKAKADLVGVVNNYEINSDKSCSVNYSQLNAQVASLKVNQPSVVDNTFVAL